MKVEKVAWCDEKNQLTTTYRWFLAGWAKQLSWKGVAETFDTTWQNVFRSVKHAVSWGLAHRNVEEFLPDAWKVAHPQHVRDFRAEELQQRADDRRYRRAKQRIDLAKSLA